MSDANVHLTDGNGHAQAVIINETSVPNASVYEALVASGAREVAELVRWSITTQGDMGSGRMGSFFQRDRYVTPDRIFDQFKVAYDAVDSDDVVSGVAESTEALAFNRIAFAANEEDEEDIWNQIAFDIDLESRIREMWRELFTNSQFYALTWWGQKSYKVRGKSDAGVTRKKTFDNLVVPLGITLLDPTKVVPVGNLMFGQEQLAYAADRTEVDMLDAAVMNDPQADPISRQIIVAKYAPPDYERRMLAKIGVNADFLYILNPRNAWRHTLTRSQFQRFAQVRMKSIFELLDLKNQLRQMDRAYLIGGTNFIILVKKGTDHLPAKPEEVQQLVGQVNSVARVPILVGDHRLAVEIVTPKTDFTLSPDKYSTVNSAITSRLYGMFIVHGGAGQPRSDDSVKLAKVIARGLESRRYLLKRTLERRVIYPAVEANDQLLCLPSLRYHPTRIDLAFDPATAMFVQDARDRGDMSRETYLSQLDIDQEWEAIQRQRELARYDKWFTMTNVPYSAPGPGHAVPVGPEGRPNEEPAGTSTNAVPAVVPHSHGPDGTVSPPPFVPKKTTRKTPGATKAPGSAKSAGRKLGGTRNGGGAAPGTGQGQPPRSGRAKNT